ncbi:MAG: hypothetical protein ACLTLE_04970 [Lachnospiraceae bacterium]
MKTSSDAVEMRSNYPLHEASIANGCEKLMKRYQIAAEDLE